MEGEGRLEGTGEKEGERRRGRGRRGRRFDFCCEDGHDGYDGGRASMGRGGGVGGCKGRRVGFDEICLRGAGLGGRRSAHSIL